MITAVILSKAPVQREILGVTVVNHVSRFTTASGLLQARMDAMNLVKTPHFFFLDDDDELPEDYTAVLARCVAASVAVAYTDELVVNDAGVGTVRYSEPYSEDAFLASAVLIHHLAVCRTTDALHVRDHVPRGEFMFENLFYFELAKRGAKYVPGVGYIWRRNPTGLSRGMTMLFAMAHSARWAHLHRGQPWQSA